MVGIWGLVFTLWGLWGLREIVSDWLDARRFRGEG
jgi:hypothetical protein